MKALKVFAILAMLLVPLSVRAICIGQETTVVFINGVWTTETEAIKHKNSLAAKSYAAGISPSCVHFTYSHTQDDTKSRDIAEALIQKSNELGIPLLTMVRAFFALFVLDAKMTFAIDDVLVSGYQETITLIDTELDKHLQKFRDAALNFGHRGIAVTHSQGGLYGNAIWSGLSEAERSNTRLITVSNPSSGAIDGGPNTRLSRDGVANRFFLGASLEGIISNTDRPCDTEAEKRPDSWPCHGFETGYLHDVEARNQIVGDIKEALPHATILGTVQTIGGGLAGGATVSLFSGSTLIAETVATPITAGYRFDNVPAPCSECFVKAKSAGNVCGIASASVIPGDLKVADITLSGSCDVSSTATVSGQLTSTDGPEPVAGADVLICRLAGEVLDQFCETILAETVSGSDGRYQFSNLPECSPCRVIAIASISSTFFFGQTDFVLNTGGVVTAGILLEPVILQ